MCPVTVKNRNNEHDLCAHIFLEFALRAAGWSMTDRPKPPMTAGGVRASYTLVTPQSPGARL